MSELVDIRMAIASLLDPIPELVKVYPYERADVATNNLPAASIFLFRVEPPAHAQQELVRFGTGDFQAEWRINIRLSGPEPVYEVKSQKLFETMHQRIRAALAPASQLLSDSTNTTFISLLTAGELFVPPDATGPFIAVFTLTTITLT